MTVECRICDTRHNGTPESCERWADDHHRLGHTTVVIE